MPWWRVYTGSVNIDSHGGIERALHGKQERAWKSPFVIIIVLTEFLRAHEWMEAFFRKARHVTARQPCHVPLEIQPCPAVSSTQGGTINDKRNLFGEDKVGDKAK